MRLIIEGMIFLRFLCNQNSLLITLSEIKVTTNRNGTNENRYPLRLPQNCAKSSLNDAHHCVEPGRDLNHVLFPSRSDFFQHCVRLPRPRLTYYRQSFVIPCLRGISVACPNIRAGIIFEEHNTQPNTHSGLMVLQLMPVILRPLRYSTLLRSTLPDLENEPKPRLELR